RRILGQIIGDGEPRRFVDDKRMRIWPNARIVVKRRQRDAIERDCAVVGLRATRAIVELHQHWRAAHLTKAAISPRRRLVEGDKLLAIEKAEIGGSNPRSRAEWRAMRLLALAAVAMRGSHQGAINLKPHAAAQAAAP